MLTCWTTSSNLKSSARARSSGGASFSLRWVSQLTLQNPYSDLDLILILQVYLEGMFMSPHIHRMLGAAMLGAYMYPGRDIQASHTLKCDEQSLDPLLCL